MSFYTTAIEGLPGMLLDVEDPIGNFKRKRYPTAFEAYYEQHLGTLEALENGDVGDMPELIQALGRNRKKQTELEGQLATARAAAAGARW